MQDELAQEETALKHDVERYWNKRATAFSALHWDELRSGKRDLWAREIDRYLPRTADGAPLRILDIGTGSGFFALMLAARGHDVTGIDLSPAMVAEASAAARRLGSSARFLVMDAERPQFAPGTFDAIVTRNLTCFLPSLETAYRNWRELLREGGMLLNFDADYGREEPAPAAELPADHAHKDIPSELNREYEGIRTRLGARQKPRPVWDRELLGGMGFRDIVLDANVSNRVYARPDRFYNPVPMFAIKAVR